MDQQNVRAGLGGGGGGPVDQQQGDGAGGAGELATVTGVIPGQGVGAVLRRGYVCQEIILLPKGPLLLPTARGLSISCRR